MLDFSQRPELQIHARIVAAVEVGAASVGIPVLIAGAFARDLHLLYRHAIDTERQTEDVDFALALPHWDAFLQLKEHLIASHAFRATADPLRLRHVSDLPIDLVPFGQVEKKDRTVALPPNGDFLIDVFGFREALASADTLILPPDVRSNVVSLAGLALLKLVCWQHRHYAHPRKDAVDLRIIAANYLRAGNEHRLWDEFVDWTQEDEFDYESAGARLLGHDIRALLDRPGIERLAVLLSEQADESTPARLPAEMNTHDPDRARGMLESMLSGLVEDGL